MTPASALRAGFGRGGLTVFEPDLGMFGWGHPDNTSRGVATPLEARALVLEERATGRRLAHVVCDLGMISEALHRAVVRRVCTDATGLAEHDVMLTATHTHSAPSGYSTYLFYALAGPGFSRRVHDALVDGIAAAVHAAVAALEPARAWVHHGWIPASEPVAFNRSVAAYNANPDASPVTAERSDEAVDRTMTVLRVDAVAGEALGVLTWFAVHGTSVHSDNRWLHGDNKGCAARATEAWGRAQGARGFVAMFAQESAGDVSPNYRWHARRRRMIGRYDDDDASASFNGEVQARHARALWALAREQGDEVLGPLDAALRYRDFFALGAAPDARTAPPRLGFAFSVGTDEGAGPFFALRGLMPWLARAQARVVRRGAAGSWRAAHGAKFPFWDLGHGARNRVLGVLPTDNPLLDVFSQRALSYYRRAIRTELGREGTWVPRYLPVQQFRIGPLLVAALPNEPTTVAGRRIRARLAAAWQGAGVARVVVNGYANAYTSYMTTPEEYALQAYEGASTLYGQWTLPVFCAELVELARAMRAGDGRATLGEVPPDVPLEACLAR